MRNGMGAGWGALFVVISAVARAQAPAVAWSVEPEYRPSLAVLEVVASDLASIERAQQLEVELLAMLAVGEQFGTVMSPAELRQREPARELDCNERKCLEETRARLKMHRLLRLAVHEQETGSRVTMVGLDPALPSLVHAEFDIPERSSPSTPAQRDVAFLDKVIPQLRAALWALAVPNAKLIVENADPTLPVFVGGSRVGHGRVEVFRPRGDVMVSIGGSTYEADDHAVTLKPGETTTVELHLVAKSVVTVMMVKKPYAGLMTRPAAYVAMTGLTLLTLGAGLGFGTLVTGARLAEPGAPVQVTRLDAMNAPAQAVVANILIAAGVALSAGGIAWIAFTPTTSSVGIDRSTPGWTLSLGGKL